MRRIHVTSTNLVSVGYDPLSATLEIEFHDASIYRYSGVPERDYLALTSGALSVGRYFNANLKGRYPCVRVA